MNNQKTRAALLGVVAVYLLFAAFKIYEGRMDPGNNVAPVVMIIIAVLFFLIAAGLLVYAWKSWMRSDREEKEKQARDDPDNTK